MFLYIILKACLYAFQKNFDFGNRLKNIWIVNNFVWKDQKYSFCRIKQILTVQKIFKKNIFEFNSTKFTTYTWAIHTTLYRVCCIEYTRLFVNTQFYAVLCISYFKCIFLGFKQCDRTKPTLLLKNIWKKCV